MKNMKMIKKITTLFITFAMAATTLIFIGNVQAANPTESLKALKFEIEWADTVTSSDTVVSRFGLSNTGAWPLNMIYNGESLSYEVYIPSTGNYVYGMGGFDGQSPNIPGNWFPSSYTDQNGDSTFTQLNDRGTDKWLKRDVAFTSDTTFWHLGPSVITAGYDMTSMAGKKSTVYYRNIKILSAGGNRTIYDGSSAVTAYLVEGAATYSNKIKSITITDGTYSFIISNTPTATPTATPTTTPTSSVSPSVTPGVSPSVTPGSTEVVPPSEKCLQYEISWKSPMTDPVAPMFDWRNINGAGAFAESAVLGAGDKLLYEIYIPTNGNYLPGMGGIDYQTAISWRTFRFFAGEQFDKDGNSLFSDLATEYGLDHWITREFTLDANLADGNGLQHIGPAMLIGANDYLNVKSLAGKKSVVYYKNIRILHNDGSISAIFGATGKMTSTESVETHLQNYATVRLSMINNPATSNTKGNASTSDSSIGWMALAALILSGAMILKNIATTIKPRKRGSMN